MSYLLPPGGLFPLTTRPTGNSAGGQYPLPETLHAAILSLQAAGGGHAAAGPAGAVNTGRWVFALGTFDGTTIACHRFTESGLASATSTALTGTWHTASTAAVQIAARNSTLLLPGTASRCAVWNDRALTAADAGWLGSIAFGG